MQPAGLRKVVLIEEFGGAEKLKVKDQGRAQRV